MISLQTNSIKGERSPEQTDRQKENRTQRKKSVERIAYLQLYQPELVYLTRKEHQEKFLRGNRKAGKIKIRTLRGPLTRKAKESETGSQSQPGIMHYYSKLKDDKSDGQLLRCGKPETHGKRKSLQ